MGGILSCGGDSEEDAGVAAARRVSQANNMQKAEMSEMEKEKAELAALAAEQAEQDVDQTEFFVLVPGANVQSVATPAKLNIHDDFVKVTITHKKDKETGAPLAQRTDDFPFTAIYGLFYGDGPGGMLLSFYMITDEGVKEAIFKTSKAPAIQRAILTRMDFKGMKVAKKGTLDDRPEGCKGPLDLSVSNKTKRDIQWMTIQDVNQDMDIGTMIGNMMS
mmetsp:Transcript_27202/g.33007  ORF Transcript_27202/g.33007 Transcript_27202/m.33007 type:complete len:219 (-) Transcript_27202:147-803(-)|eukprot:CAMPEP_0197845046 /NCGR_PEP_ID=MMETSP1438-20131217/2001_1 /TAXON_ID=1461541 /ORGANISM="Pterosperma sp., Strain CCMP1384" /LENGTH=218 /DNA_ID=CAMNT_0043456131 /DNA_START=122 /DNA_END=778 /DNA_ORIENTATION=+